VIVSPTILIRVGNQSIYIEYKINISLDRHEESIKINYNGVGIKKFQGGCLTSEDAALWTLRSDMESLKSWIFIWKMSPALRKWIFGELLCLHSSFCDENLWLNIFSCLLPDNDVNWFSPHCPYCMV
jgi:hypothetical protein